MDWNRRPPPLEFWIEPRGLKVQIGNEKQLNILTMLHLFTVAELRFSAACDSTGHTSLSVRLRSGPYPLDWSISAALLLEAGGLERIATEVEKFVGNK